MIATARPARLLCRAIAFCAVVGAFLLYTAATASANTSLDFWHFNMCGARKVSPCNAGNEQPVSDAIKSSIEHYEPDAVSLNEACQSQWATTLWNLNAAGVWNMNSRFNSTRYLEDPAWDSPVQCNEYDRARRFGNALFSKQTILKASLLTSYDLSTDENEKEQRKLWCMLVALHYDTYYCTAHIAPTPREETAAQIQRVANIVNRWVDAGTPVVLMGDFNAQPGDSRMNPIYHPVFGNGAVGRFEEIDQHQNIGYTRCRCGEVTTDDGAKADYIFVSARAFEVVYGDAIPSSYSDHSVLRGSATLLHP
ncbi:MAG TPA: endonuclease/exonuclease/phosphatase family protein [Thermoleophilaceae bacterium]|jgi:endonuclease/exonuclease/phosphatase family metal-dependent hydrolase